MSGPRDNWPSAKGDAWGSKGIWKDFDKTGETSGGGGGGSSSQGCLILVIALVYAASIAVAAGWVT